MRDEYDFSGARRAKDVPHLAELQEEVAESGELTVTVTDRWKTPIRDPAVMERMAVAFDLFDTAEQMMRQNLRRRNPDATEEEIEEGIRAWLWDRPGAEHGDGEGVPGDPSRFDR